LRQKRDQIKTEVRSLVEDLKSGTLTKDEQDRQKKRIKKLLADLSQLQVQIKELEPDEITNSIGIKLVLIPAGKFIMGSPQTEPDRDDNEGPEHEVEITEPFYLGVYLVTQEEYEKVMGNNPSWFSSTGGGKNKVAGLDTKRFPVETVSWEDAVEFCRKLSELPE